MIKIGELSNITGISIQTIRFYESEGLISPTEVDRWTNYRYYDESAVVRLSEINYLKDLGFSLKEIKNLDSKTIAMKLIEIQKNISKLKQNYQKLSTIRKKDGGFKMKNFVNDEKVIGKWKKVAVVNEKEDYKKKECIEEDIFDFPTLYFLPNGEKYWVFSWTKGTLYVTDREMPYEIIDGTLYIGVVDFKTGLVDAYAVYEKVTDKMYTVDEIIVNKDDTNIPFKTDKNVIGFWEAQDFVMKKEDFIPNKKQFQGDLFWKKLTFEPDGTLLVTKENKINKLEWSNGVVICKGDNAVDKYEIKEINGAKYMFLEWKSGDWMWGDREISYYVLKKID